MLVTLTRIMHVPLKKTGGGKEKKTRKNIISFDSEQPKEVEYKFKYPMYERILNDYGF